MEEKKPTAAEIEPDASYKKLIKMRVKQIVDKYGEVLARDAVDRVTLKMLAELKTMADDISNAQTVEFVLKNHLKYLKKIDELADAGNRWALEYLLSFVDGGQGGEVEGKNKLRRGKNKKDEGGFEES